MTKLTISPLYPILDAALLPAEMAARERYLVQAACALARAGVTLLQYRNKLGPDGELLRDLRWLRTAAPHTLRVLVNDRVHLVAPSGCDGVHLGQGDTPVEQARATLGNGAIIGLSTHSAAELRGGDDGPADYLAIGPVYETGSKANPEPVVGLEGVRQARLLTVKPLVAIGGITLDRAAGVRAAGADSVAVISALFASAGDPEQVLNTTQLAKLAEDFLHIFR